MAYIMVSWHTCYKLLKVPCTKFFVAWEGFMEAISSILNLRTSDGFLSYSLPEVFIKTVHGPQTLLLTVMNLIYNNLATMI